MNIFKAKILTLSLFAGIFILPSFAFAIGQMSQPIIVTNAAKGQVIISTLKLYGEAQSDKLYNLIAEGDIKDWVKFYAIEDRNNPITSVNIPKGKNIDIVPEVRVQFKDIDQTKVLFTSVFPYPESEAAIKPLERKEIPTIEVPLNFSNGRYWAFVSIWEKGESRFENKFRFQIGGAGSILGSAFSAITGGFNIWYIIIPFAVIALLAIIVLGMKMRKRAH